MTLCVIVDGLLNIRFLFHITMITSFAQLSKQKKRFMGVYLTSVIHFRAEIFARRLVKKHVSDNDPGDHTGEVSE